MRKGKLAALCLAASFCLTSCGGGGAMLVAVEERAPTCTEDGYKMHYRTEDGASLFWDGEGERAASWEELALPALGHDFGGWQETRPATCTQEGEETSVCSRCGDEKHREIPALGHLYAGEETEDEAPTCLGKGSASRHCVRCGDKTEERELAPLGHSFGSGEEVQAPTCTEPGEEKFVCSLCGEEKREKIPALGHDFTEWRENRVNCLLEGELVRVCRRCPEKEQKTLAPRDSHTFDAENRCIYCSFKIEESEGLVYEKIVGQGKELGFSVSGGSSSGKSVVIPQYHEGMPIIEIAENAFKDREDLTEFVSYAKIGTVGASAFFGCVKLLDFSFSYVKEVGENAFRNCRSLKEIVLPDETERVAKQAFYGCYGLERIEIGAGLFSLGSQAFYGCSVAEKIDVSPRNSHFRGEGNCLVDSSDTLLLGSCKSVIPESVKEIGSYAFVGCEALEEIRIPAGVQTIGSYAFADCTGLKKISFGGTEREWASVDKGNGWDLHCNYAMIFEK